MSYIYVYFGNSKNVRTDAMSVNWMLLSILHFSICDDQWSSPLSGPKRFEYDDKAELWYCSKDNNLQLGPTLAKEIKSIHPSMDEIQLSV